MIRCPWLIGTSLRVVQKRRPTFTRLDDTKWLMRSPTLVHNVQLLTSLQSLLSSLNGIIYHCSSCLFIPRSRVSIDLYPASYYLIINLLMPIIYLFVFGKAGSSIFNLHSPSLSLSLMHNDGVLVPCVLFLNSLSFFSLPHGIIFTSVCEKHPQ